MTIAKIQTRNNDLIQYSNEKLELIKRTVCKGATDDELQLFLHVAGKTGLDVFSRQMYAIKRYDNVERREVMTFQTGIDGYRLIASRTGLHAGTDEAIFLIDENTGRPIYAKVTVYKLINSEKVSFTATARYSEYVATKRDGMPNNFWQSKPFLMLEKCAESLALRKAFPNELSGIYTDEEMQQAENVLNEQNHVKSVTTVNIESPVKNLDDEFKKYILEDIKKCSSMSELENVFKCHYKCAKQDAEFLFAATKEKDKRKNELQEDERQALVEAMGDVSDDN